PHHRLSALSPLSSTWDRYHDRLTALSPHGILPPHYENGQERALGGRGRHPARADGALGAVLSVSFAGICAYGAESSAVVHPDLWPQARPPLASDPKLEQKVAALLAHMSLEQKVGQLI